MLNTPHSIYDRRTFLMGGTHLLVTVGGLAACSSPPPTAPKVLPTMVELTITADADLNPDVRGRASPLHVRVYALKTLGVFNSADFFALHEKDQATLGAELIRKEELLLSPSQTHRLKLILSDDVRVLAFMALYRDLERARWRDSTQLALNKSQRVVVRCMSKQLMVQHKLGPS